MDLKLANYYREKRIQRILSFYSRLQPASRLTGKRASMVSRDSIIQVIATFVCLMICGLPLSVLAKQGGPPAVSMALGGISAFIAVELADWILLRIRRTLDLTFDVVLPWLAAFLIAATVIGVRYLDWATIMPQRFEEWRLGVNDRLQRRPLTIRLRQTSSTDWKFATNAQGQLTPLTKQEAEIFCAQQGLGWNVYAGTAHSDILSSGAFYIWMNPGWRAAQIEPGGLLPPRVFASSAEGDRRATLCVRTGGKQ